MKKKIISMLIAASLTATAAVNVFAVSDDIKSTDKEVLTQMLTNMISSEREAFTNENLDIKLQHLSTLVTLSSNRTYDKIADEVKAALDDGLTSIEIKEAIYHSAAYCGYTRAAGALDAADAALKALGEDITYKSRITSTEENRYTDGLAVQRTLFGPQIGTITDGMEESLKMQTLFLSGICFGDFYNRTGLSLYTREFLT
ncbi:MAG: carboxymuconolactone decarboxylase family protein, partial [Candidatus Ornithomonoglobus sp.]